MTDKIKLYKKYKGENEVRSIDVNNTKNNVMQALKNGFFLTEQEAEDGKIAGTEEKKEPEPKAPAKKPAPKVATVKKQG